MFIWKPYKRFKQRVILIIQSRGDIIHKKPLGVYDAGRSSRQQRGENWNTIKNKENKTILFLPISTFFLATFSLPASVSSVCAASVSLLPSPRFRSRVLTFWSNLRGNARYASYRFSPSCVAGRVFLRVRVLATNPLFSAVCQRKGEALDRRQI